MNQKSILMFFAIVFLYTRCQYAQELPVLRPKAGVSTETADELIKQLRSSSYESRIAATQKLVQLGKKTVDPLFDAILSSDFETSFRATKIVKDIGLNSDLDTLEIIIRKSQSLPEEKRHHFDEWSLQAISNWKERKSKLAESELVKNGATVIEVDQFAELGLMLIDDISYDLQTAKGEKAVTVKSVLEQIQILKKEMAGEAVVEKTTTKTPEEFDQRIQKFELGGRFVLPAGGEIVSPAINPKSNPVHVKIDSDWNGEPKDLLQLRFIENLNQIEFVEVDVTPEILNQLSRIRKLRSLLLTRCSFSFSAVKEFKKQKDTQYPLQLMATGPGYLGVYGPNSGEPNDGTGSFVSLVSPNSAASAAGLERGDMITRVDEDRIHSFAELSLVISSKPVGKEIKIAVQRENEEKVLTAKLKSRNGLR